MNEGKYYKLLMSASKSALQATPFSTRSSFSPIVLPSRTFFDLWFNAYAIQQGALMGLVLTNRKYPMISSVSLDKVKNVNRFETITFINFAMP